MHEVSCKQSSAGMKWEVGARCELAGNADATPVTVIEHKVSSTPLCCHGKALTRDLLQDPARKPGDQPCVTVKFVSRRAVKRNALLHTAVVFLFAVSTARLDCRRSRLAASVRADCADFWLPNSFKRNLSWLHFPDRWPPPAPTPQPPAYGAGWLRRYWPQRSVLSWSMRLRLLKCPPCMTPPMTDGTQPAFPATDFPISHVASGGL